MGSSRTSTSARDRTSTRERCSFRSSRVRTRRRTSQALANLARDKETNANAQKEVERYQSLVKQDYVTQEQADQQRATAGASAATVQADEAAVENAKFNLDNTKIRAPISGRTGGLLVREGNVVHAGGTTPLVVINQISPILVRFAVPATELPLIQQYGGIGPARRHRRAGRRAPERAGYGGRPIRAATPAATRRRSRRRARIHPRCNLLAQLSARARHALLHRQRGGHAHRNGACSRRPFRTPRSRCGRASSSSTTLHLFIEQHALVVPSEAVVTGQQGTYVYVVDSASTAQQRKVSVERTQGSAGGDHGRAARWRAGGAKRAVAAQRGREGEGRERRGLRGARPARGPGAGGARAQHRRAQRPRK